MHKPKDENGNPVNCQSNGSCFACHTHTGASGLSALPDPETPQQMEAVLSYLLRQNQQMDAYLNRYLQKLMDMDREEAAMHLQKASEEYSKGNLYLSLALSLVKED